MAAQDIVNAYQAKLGRGPDARELESELENDSKYGHQRFLDELDTRAKRTFSGGGTGGDADTDGNGVADAGWMRNPEAGAGRAWIRESERPRSLSDLLQPRQQGPAPGQWDGGYTTGPGPSYGNDYRGYELPPGVVLPTYRGPSGDVPRFTTMPVSRRNTLASLLTYGA